MPLTLEQALLILGLISGTSVIGAAISIYSARASKRNLVASAENNEAAAVKQYAEATALYAQEVKVLRSELGRLRREILKRDQMIDHLNDLLTQKNMTIEDLQDWAERLVAQVKQYGGVEVEPERIRIRKVVVSTMYPEIDSVSEDAAIPVDTRPSEYHIAHTRKEDTEPVLQKNLLHRFLTYLKLI